MRKIRLFCCLIILFYSTFAFAQNIAVDVMSLEGSHKTTGVTVTTSATALPATALLGRRTILVQNVTDTVVYLGNANVTADETSTAGYQMQNDGDVWIGDTYFFKVPWVSHFTGDNSGCCGFWADKVCLCTLGSRSSKEISVASS